MTSFAFLTGQLLRSQIQNKTLLPQHLSAPLSIFYHNQFLGKKFADFDIVISSPPSSSSEVFGLAAIGTVTNGAVYSMTSRAFFRFNIFASPIKTLPFFCSITYDGSHGVAGQTDRVIGLADTAFVAGGGPGGFTEPTDGIYVEFLAPLLSNIKLVCINGGVSTRVTIPTNSSTNRHTVLLVVDEFSPGNLRARAILTNNDSSRSLTEVSSFTNIPNAKKLKIALAGIKPGVNNQGIQVDSVLVGGVRG